MYPLLPPLHLLTLMIASAIAIAFCGALLIVARRTGGRGDPAVLWGVSMVTGAAGYVVAVLGHGAPAIQDGLSTSLFLAAVALSWVGACSFAERRLSWIVAAAGPALWTATIPLQPAMHALPQAWVGQAWVAFACLIGVAYTLGTAYELGLDRREFLPSRRLALVLLLIHAATYAARGLVGLVVGEHSDLDDSLIVVLTFESLLHSIGMAFLLLSLLLERMELRSTAQLRTLTRQDGLTGIANRRHFDQTLETELRQADRLQSPVALLMIDVDHFKAFNDALGHQEGDSCLIGVARALAALAHRPRDLLARYGGEEFVMLLPDTDLPGAIRVAEQARAAIEALGMHHPWVPRSADAPESEAEAEAGRVTISVGAAAAGPGSAQRSARFLLHLADRAMYEAKAAGRNTVRAAVHDRPEEISA